MCIRDRGDAVVQYNGGDLGGEPDMIGLFEVRLICFVDTAFVDNELISTAVLNNVTKLIDEVQLECGDQVFAAGSIQIKQLSFSVRADGDVSQLNIEAAASNALRLVWKTADCATSYFVEFNWVDSDTDYSQNRVVNDTDIGWTS